MAIIISLKFLSMDKILPPMPFRMNYASLGTTNRMEARYARCTKNTIIILQSSKWLAFIHLNDIRSPQVFFFFVSGPACTCIIWDAKVRQRCTDICTIRITPTFFMIMNYSFKWLLNSPMVELLTIIWLSPCADRMELVFPTGGVAFLDFSPP